MLAAPNLSEGRDFARLELLEGSLASATLLDRHTDLDHNRAVFTVAGEPDRLELALIGLARTAITEIDMTAWRGIHPAIGAIDVCPVIWTRAEDREQAVETALQAAIAIGKLGVPVFLYGELATAEQRRERAYFRRGGVDRLWLRMSGGDPEESDQVLKPDFGPERPHPTAGGCLVTARPPLAAFNLELETDDVTIAREIAAEIRESAAGGLPGVRALGLGLSTGRTQVSTNVHDPVSMPLARLVAAVAARAELRGTRVIEAELIGLLPEAAMAGYPEGVPIRGFDPNYHLIENRLADLPAG
ncbi:MAG: hypothetical protein M9938_09410 [Solirubrobacterales bacterium]|nr:hypothetical protein [Solirubrobacterales bacterium]